MQEWAELWSWLWLLLWGCEVLAAEFLHAERRITASIQSGSQTVESLENAAFLVLGMCLLYRKCLR